MGLLTSLPFWGGYAQITTKADPKTLAYLAAYRSDYAHSMLDERVERLQAYYGETVRFMPEYQKTVMGKLQTLTYHRAFVTRFTVQTYTRQAAEILDLGTQVMERGGFTVKLVLKSSGKAVELTGKYVTIWQKREPGKLALLTEAWNYSHPIDLGEQLRFEQVPAVHVALQAHLPINSPIRFEIAALNRLMEQTITQHDAALWAQFMTDDGMFIYSNHPIYQGRQALNGFLVKHAQELPIFEKLDIRTDRIDHLGTYVIEYASHCANWRTGEASGVTTGKDLRIWRREGNGALKIFRQMAMYD